MVQMTGMMMPITVHGTSLSTSVDSPVAMRTRVPAPPARPTPTPPSREPANRKTSRMTR